jgi:CheY-like chemotaxis protein
LLVVEVDSDAFLLLKRALWKAGATARVWWARDATEALSMLKELEMHLGRLCVLANLELPGIGSFRLLELVKAEPAKAQVKFAFLTQQEDQATQDRAFASGADGFFVKPECAEELPNLARALQQFARA